MKKKRTNLTDVKKIGIFGGTFDPVHVGHMIIAEKVREQAGLDVILFIPSANPPHKHHVLMFTPKQRYKMLKEAIKGNPCFIISDIEMKREGPSYTSETLHEIQKQISSDAELYFIVGRDNLYEIELWKNPHDIIKECTILVADRVCGNRKDIPEWLKSKTKIVNVPIIEISSSEIRQRIRDGKNIRHMVPDVVLKECETV
ncbi:nicotinate-nucleotide adenylyltransferase [Candidatus Latescibacterota bacterium]